MNFKTVRLPNDVATDLATRFARLRKSRKWTQAETAHRSGVSLGSLKRFEQGGKISLQNLLALAHLFDRLSDFEEIFDVDATMLAAERRFREIDS